MQFVVSDGKKAYARGGVEGSLFGSTVEVREVEERSRVELLCTHTKGCIFDRGGVMSGSRKRVSFCVILFGVEERERGRGGGACGF